MKKNIENVGSVGGLILDELVEHFSTRKQWKALGDNFIRRRPLLYWDSPRYLPTDGCSLCWVSTSFGLHPKHVEDHWAFPFLFSIGVLQRITLPSRNHKQVSLVLTGGKLCFWVMPMETRTNLFEVRIEQSDIWKSDNQVKTLTIRFFFGEFWSRMFQDLNLDVALRTSR